MESNNKRNDKAKAKALIRKKIDICDLLIQNAVLFTDADGELISRGGPKFLQSRVWLSSILPLGGLFELR